MVYNRLLFESIILNIYKHIRKASVQLLWLTHQITTGEITKCDSNYQGLQYITAELYRTHQVKSPVVIDLVPNMTAEL